MANNQDQDSIGWLGEIISSVFLSRKTPRGYLFRTLLIGGKWPTIDLYVELMPDKTAKLNAVERMFFFVQVKATTLGYLKKNGNLRVKVSADDLNRLANYCGPTYLIGIDLDEANPRESKAYIKFIKSNYSQPLSSLHTAHALDTNNLVALYDEVVNFWNVANTLAVKASFTSAF